MRFRRSSARYGETPEPATPYQRAGQAWDERLGSARVQATNWRLMAFGCLGLAMGSAGGLLWQGSQASVTPYVVEVDRSGQVRAVGPAAEAYKPSDAQIAFHLAGFITAVRALPSDPVLVRQNWLEAYDFTTDRGALALNDYARREDPFAKLGRTSIAVEVTSVVRASPGSFQVRWIERAYVDGALSATERWTAIVGVVLQPPRTEAKLRKNPLGVYVDALNWSRELGSVPGDRP